MTMVGLNISVLTLFCVFCLITPSCSNENKTDDTDKNQTIVVDNKDDKHNAGEPVGRTRIENKGKKIKNRNKKEKILERRHNKKTKEKGPKKNKKGYTRIGSCTGTTSHWSCCSVFSPCQNHEGDCDRNSDCAGSLVCGKDNCKKFNPLAHPVADCCVGCEGTSSDWNCCSSTSPCHATEGDCDSDSECAGSLVCGINNCRNFNPSADALADCCIKPNPTGCVEDDNIDYYGHDIPDKTRIVDGLEECIKWCGDTTACKYWSFVKSTQRCWLKTSDSDKRQNSDRISGTKNCGIGHLMYLTSPNYPNNYPNNQHTIQVMSVPKGHFIQVTFYDFQIEDHSSCRYDYIQFCDENGKCLDKMCGTNIPQDFIIETSTATVLLHTDGSVALKGFILSYQPVRNCPLGWISAMTGCYKFVDSFKWSQGATNCKNAGGFLAEINSQEEQDTLWQIYQDSGLFLNHVYIGATDKAQEGTWIWDHSGKEITFTAWNDQYSEPNGGTIENCLTARTNWNWNFKWNDIPCNQRYENSKAICESDWIGSSSVYFIAGGDDTKRDISVYHPTVDNVACSISPPTLNNDWRRHTTFYHDNPSTIHLCGGRYTASTCISHNKDTGGWKTHTLTTSRWIGHSSVVLHDKVFFVGGYDSSWNYVGAESTPLPFTDTPVLTPEHNLDYKGVEPCTATIDEDTLVVTGGYHFIAGSSYLTTVATYNVKTLTYTQLPSLKQARHWHRCGVLERGNTKWIIVTGGVSSSGGRLQSTEMLQLGGSEWTRLGDLNGARYGHSMDVTQRGVMVMGGWYYSGSLLSSVELLDWDSTGKTWSVVQPSLNKPTADFGGAVEIPASMFGCTV